MAAGKLNLTIEQGTDFSRLFRVEQPAGSPVVVSNPAAMIRTTATTGVNGAPVVSFTAVLGGSGEFTLSLTKAQTSALPVDADVRAEKGATKYAWDVEVDIGGKRERLLEGIVYVTPEVTR